MGLVFLARVVSVMVGEIALGLAGASFPVFDVNDEALGLKLTPGGQGWRLKEGEGSPPLFPRAGRSAARLTAGGPTERRCSADRLLSVSQAGG
jgi:hypothetical protein